MIVKVRIDYVNRIATTPVVTLVDSSPESDCQYFTVDCDVLGLPGRILEIEIQNQKETPSDASL